MQQLEELPTPMTPTATSGRLRVLIAEDHLDVAYVQGLLLRLWGYDVQVARTGVAALEAIRDSHPDVALIDILLPGLDGYQVATRIREDPTLADVTLVALTGLDEEVHRRRSAEAGFAVHLVKPVAPDRLHAILQHLAEQKQASHSALPDAD